VSFIRNGQLELLSAGLLFKHILEAVQDGRSPVDDPEVREWLTLYITLTNMPGYDELVTRFIKKEINERDFVVSLIKGEFRRINEPKNGQGRLAKVTNALNAANPDKSTGSQGQVAAFMFAEYASWYDAGWSGFHAAMDTFKPLGGTTGYFCTEAVEDIDWEDPVVQANLNITELHPELNRAVQAALGMPFDPKIGVDGTLEKIHGFELFWAGTNAQFRSAVTQKLNERITELQGVIPGAPSYGAAQRSMVACRELLDRISRVETSVAVATAAGATTEELSFPRFALRLFDECQGKGDVISEHYRAKNKLLAIGAWDEFQVAEDFMLGFVSWWNGFNIAGFYSLTPENPAGFEAEVGYKFRPKQISRWIKGYNIGYLIFTENIKNRRDLMERKGFWGYVVFLLPTLSSAVNPLLFAVARFVTKFWWVYYLPIVFWVDWASMFPLIHGLLQASGLGQALLGFQNFIQIFIPNSMNFLNWAIGAPIVILPFALHTYFTLRGIFRGIDNRLGMQKIIDEHKELLEDIENKTNEANGRIIQLSVEVSALREIIKRELVAATQANDELRKANLVPLSARLESVERTLAELQNRKLADSDLDSVERLWSEVESISSSMAGATITIPVQYEEAKKEVRIRNEVIIKGELTRVDGLISPERFVQWFGAMVSGMILAVILPSMPGGAFVTFALWLIGSLLAGYGIRVLFFGRGPDGRGLAHRWIDAGVELTPENLYDNRNNQDFVHEVISIATQNGLPDTVDDIIAVLRSPDRATQKTVRRFQSAFRAATLAKVHDWHVAELEDTTNEPWVRVLEERRIRAAIVRTAGPSLFIGFYHGSVYVPGNIIAWQELLVPRRAGFWWRTPRVLKEREQVEQRYLPALWLKEQIRSRGKPETEHLESISQMTLWSKEEIGKSRTAKLWSLVKGEWQLPELEKDLEHTRLWARLVGAWSFMASMLLLICYGFRSDLQKRVVTEYFNPFILGNPSASIPAVTQFMTSHPVLFTLIALTIAISTALYISRKLRIASGAAQQLPTKTTPGGLPLKDISSLPSSGLEPFKKYWHWLMLPVNDGKGITFTNIDDLAAMLQVADAEKKGLETWYRMLQERTLKWMVGIEGIDSGTLRREASDMIQEYESSHAGLQAAPHSAPTPPKRPWWRISLRKHTTLITLATFFTVTAVFAGESGSAKLWGISGLIAVIVLIFAWEMLKNVLRPILAKAFGITAPATAPPAATLRVEADPKILAHIDKLLEEARLSIDQDPELIGVAAIVVDKEGRELTVATQTRSTITKPTKKKYDHAEINALNAMRTQGIDADIAEDTLIISLEPCEFCAKAIVNSGIRKVVIATLEPGQRVFKVGAPAVEAGAGVRTLLAAGIEVTILPPEAQRMAADFIIKRQEVIGKEKARITASDMLTINASPIAAWPKMDVKELKATAREYLDHQTAETHASRFDIYEFDRLVTQLLKEGLRLDGDRLPQIIAINANAFDESIPGARENTNWERRIELLIGAAKQASDPKRPFYIVVAGNEANRAYVLSKIASELPEFLKDAFILEGLGADEELKLTKAEAKAEKLPKDTDLAIAQELLSGVDTQSVVRDVIAESGLTVTVDPAKAAEALSPANFKFDDHERAVFAATSALLSGNKAAFLDYKAQPSNMTIGTFTQYAAIAANITSRQRDLLWTAMILHDMGKRIAPAGHALISGRLADRFLQGKGFTQDEVDLIKWLVSYHDFFGNVFTGERKADFILGTMGQADAAEQQLRLKMLQLVTVCDMKGTAKGKYLDDGKASFYLKLSDPANLTWMSEQNNIYAWRINRWGGTVLGEDVRARATALMDEIEKLGKKDAVERYFGTALSHITNGFYIFTALAPKELALLLARIAVVIEGSDPGMTNIRLDFTAPYRPGDSKSETMMQALRAMLTDKYAAEALPISLEPGIVTVDTASLIEPIKARPQELPQAPPAINAEPLTETEATNLLYSDDFGFGVYSGTDTGAIVFKMDVPGEVKEEVLRDLAANGMSTRVLFTTNGKKVPMDLILKLWRDGIIKSLNDLEKASINTTDGWAALNVRDGKAFLRWMDEASAEIDGLGEESQKKSARTALNKLRHSINSHNRSAEAVIIRPRISRQELLDRYGEAEGATLLVNRIIQKKIDLYNIDPRRGKVGRKLDNEERDEKIRQLGAGGLEVGDIIKMVAFQDFLKYVIMGDTNIADAHPSSVRGGLRVHIEAALRGKVKKGAIAELIADARRLGVEDSVWYIDTLAHCASSDVIKAEKEDYRKIGEIGTARGLPSFWKLLARVGGLISRVANNQNALMTIALIAYIAPRLLGYHPPEYFDLALFGMTISSHITLPPTKSMFLDRGDLFDGLNTVEAINERLIAEIEGKRQLIRDLVPPEEAKQYLDMLPDPEFVRRCLLTMFTSDHVTKHKKDIYNEVFDVWQLYKVAANAGSGKYFGTINELERVTSNDMKCAQVIVVGSRRAITDKSRGEFITNRIAESGLNNYGYYTMFYGEPGADQAGNVHITVIQIYDPAKLNNFPTIEALKKFFRAPLKNVGFKFGNRKNMLVSFKSEKKALQVAIEICEAKLAGKHRCGSNGIPGGTWNARIYVYDPTYQTGGTPIPEDGAEFLKMVKGIYYKNNGKAFVVKKGEIRKEENAEEGKREVDPFDVNTISGGLKATRVVISHMESGDKITKENKASELIHLRSILKPEAARWAGSTKVDEVFKTVISEFDNPIMGYVNITKGQDSAIIQVLRTYFLLVWQQGYQLLKQSTDAEVIKTTQYNIKAWHEFFLPLIAKLNSGYRTSSSAEDIAKENGVFTESISQAVMANKESGKIAAADLDSLSADMHVYVPRRIAEGYTARFAIWEWLEKTYPANEEGQRPGMGMAAEILVTDILLVMDEKEISLPGFAETMEEAKAFGGVVVVSRETIRNRRVLDKFIKAGVKVFVTSKGSATDHYGVIITDAGAILVPNLPMVVFDSLVATGRSISVYTDDIGYHSVVYIGDAYDTIGMDMAMSVMKAEALKKFYLEWERIKTEEHHGSYIATTMDNVEVPVYGNMQISNNVADVLAKMDELRKAGANGIGLARSEFMYMGSAAPTEDEQAVIYQAMSEFWANTVSIRTFDKLPEGVDNDKATPALEPYENKGGFEYYRTPPGRQALKTQLKALVRAFLASGNKNIVVMFPMVRSASDWEFAAEIYKEIKSEIVAARMVQAIGRPAADILRELEAELKGLGFEAMVELPELVGYDRATGAISMEEIEKMTANKDLPLVGFSAGSNDLTSRVNNIERPQLRDIHFNQKVIAIIESLMAFVMDKNAKAERGGRKLYVKICGEAASFDKTRNFSIYQKAKNGARGIPLILSAQTAMIPKVKTETGFIMASNLVIMVGPSWTARTDEEVNKLTSDKAKKIAGRITGQTTGGAESAEEAAIMKKASAIYKNIMNEMMHKTLGAAAAKPAGLSSAETAAVIAGASIVLFIFATIAAFAFGMYMAHRETMMAAGGATAAVLASLKLGAFIPDIPGPWRRSLSPNPPCILGIKGATQEQVDRLVMNIEALGLKHYLDDGKWIIGVSDATKLSEISARMRAPAVLIDTLDLNGKPSFDEVSKIMSYASVIVADAKVEKTRLGIEELENYYAMIHTEPRLTPAIRERIRDLILSILPDVESAGIEQAIDNLFARGVTPDIVGKVREVRNLVEAQRETFNNAYGPTAMPANTTATSKVIAVTERTALETPSFIQSVKEAKEGSATQTVFLYGDKFKTPEDAQRFLIEAGLLKIGLTLADVKLVKIGSSYAETMEAIRKETGLDVARTADIGIMAAKGEIRFQAGEKPGKETFLEVQGVAVGRTVVLATMNAYQTLLKMVIASDGKLPPGVTKDNIRGILKYLPPTLPIDYGDEIIVYRNAMMLISTAA
jgi:tRNA(Arg) A34 adenosine deaminase TadA